MVKEEFENLCKKLLPSCVVFLNPLKKGNSPENDEEYDSILMYEPKTFDEKRIPIHINVQNAFRVCFVDGDWLELGKELFVCRRTINNERLTIMYSLSNLDELKLLEGKIDKLVRTLNPNYKESSKNRIFIKTKEPKLFIGSNSGICILSFPRLGNDHLTFGYLDSLKSFSHEVVLNDIMSESLDALDQLHRSEEVKISNKILEIHTSIPIDDNLNFSIMHFNPDDIYDEINKRSIDAVKGFIRATLRRNNLLNEKFTNRIDIYTKAIQNPIYGNVSAEQMLQKIISNYLFSILLLQILLQLIQIIP